MYHSFNMRLSTYKKIRVSYFCCVYIFHPKLIKIGGKYGCIPLLVTNFLQLFDMFLIFFFYVISHYWHDFAKTMSFNKSSKKIKRRKIEETRFMLQVYHASDADKWTAFLGFAEAVMSAKKGCRACATGWGCCRSGSSSACIDEWSCIPRRSTLSTVNSVSMCCVVVWCVFGSAPGRVEEGVYEELAIPEPARPGCLDANLSSRIQRETGLSISILIVRLTRNVRGTVVPNPRPLYLWGNHLLCKKRCILGDYAVMHYC